MKRFLFISIFTLNGLFSIAQTGRGSAHGDKGGTDTVRGWQYVAKGITAGQLPSAVDTIIFQGTSITAGTYLNNIDRYSAQLCNLLGVKEKNLGQPFANLQNNDSVYRLVPAYLSRYRYLVLEYGVNDAFNYNDTVSFRTKYLQVLDSLHNSKGWSYNKIVLTTPSFTYRDSRNVTNYTALLKYNICIKNIAASRGCICPDVFTYSYHALGKGYTLEGVHPNKKGAAGIASFLAGYMTASQSTVQIRNLPNAANGYVSIIVQDKDGNLCTIPFGSLMATANVADTPTGGGINTTEPVISTRAGHFGQLHLQNFNGTNFSWLSENAVFDTGVTSGFRYQTNGFASLLYFLKGSIAIGTSPSGTAGNSVTFGFPAKFNYTGDVGIGAFSNNASDTDLNGYALRIWKSTYNVSIGVPITTDNGFKLDVYGKIRAQGNEIYIGVGGQKWIAGTGSPEGLVSAPVGSIYSRTDGGAGTTFYVKESGTGATGWIAK